MDSRRPGWPRRWAAVGASLRGRLLDSATPPARDNGHGQDAEGQPAQHDIERAGDLLGEIVSVDRAIHPGRALGRREPRSKLDPHHDAGNSEGDQESTH